jgi:hypothetical protein
MKKNTTKVARLSVSGGATFRSRSIMRPEFGSSLIMIDHKLRASVSLLALAIILQLGCGQTAQQSDPDRARETLRQALDAWQNGETQETLQKQSSITAVEPSWQAGHRLLEYEILGDGHSSGFDWQCKVRLSLQDAGGQSSQMKALYSISTAPARVIVRAEEP